MHQSRAAANERLDGAVPSSGLGRLKNFREGTARGSSGWVMANVLHASDLGFSSQKLRLTDLSYGTTGKSLSLRTQQPPASQRAHSSGTH